MAEELDPEAIPGDTAELVDAKGEPAGGDDNAAQDTASPWPVRASPYV